MEQRNLGIRNVLWLSVVLLAASCLTFTRLHQPAADVTPLEGASGQWRSILVTDGATGRPLHEISDAGEIAKVKGFFRDEHGPWIRASMGLASKYVLQIKLKESPGVVWASISYTLDRLQPWVGWHGSGAYADPRKIRYRDVGAHERLRLLRLLGIRESVE